MKRPGRVEDIADRRHDVGVERGRLLANLFTKCTSKWQDSEQDVNEVLTKADLQAKDSAKNMSVLKEKIASASKVDKVKDAQSGKGLSPMDELVQQHGMYEAQNNFYMQILENGKVVLEHVEKGLEETAALKNDIENTVGNFDRFLGPIIVEEHAARVVLKEKNFLWKQWLATSKDFSCGPPAPVDHALSMCAAGSTEYSPTCLITCLPGYDHPIDSKRSQLCQRVGKFGGQVHGEWRGLAKCVARSCGKAPEIEKAKTMGQVIRFPHAAVYNCYEGYSQNGSATGSKVFSAPCDASGHFEQASSHVCKPVSCGASPLFKGVEPNKGTFSFSDIITVKCRPGHTLDETAGGLTNFSISCQATGRFTQGHDCKPIRCGPSPEYDKTKLLSAKGEKYYDDEVKYQCQPGYSLNQEPSGPKMFTIRCDSDGKFSQKGGAANASVPQCRPVSAGMLPAVEHGLSKQREMFYGEEILITADLGYSTSAKPTDGLSFLVSVTPDGTFDGLAKFIPVTCGPPPLIEKANTSFKSKEGVYGNVIDYVCADGFSIDKSASPAATSFSIQCEANSDYSKVPSLGYCANVDDCAEHTCGPHGVCIDSFKNYSCDCESGYEQTWNNETSEFACGNINDCGPEACGVGNCQDQVNGYKCICPSGYEEVGEDDEKTCQAKICGPPPRAENAATSPVEAAAEKASYQDEVMYQCDAGYTLDATAIGRNHFSISCLATALFTGTQSCKPIECGDAPEVDHAAVTPAKATFSQTVRYTCEAGYTIDGTPSGDASFGVSCLATGQYGEASKCRPVNCGEPDEVSNSHRPDGALVYQQSVTYTCADGFSLDGLDHSVTEFKVKCHQDGSLDALGACLPNVCGEPPARINALYATESDEGEVSYPRVTEVACRDGYTVDGSPDGNMSFTVACTAMGKFETYQYTECQPVRCGPPPEMPNATLERVSSPAYMHRADREFLNYVEKAFFQCLPGFSTGGEPSASKEFVVECLPSGELSAPTVDMQCRNVNDCEQYTCGPKGTCVDLIGPSPAYTCMCEHGFEMQTKANGEKHCGNTDDCKDMDCGVGVCIDLIGDYSCSCPSGYSTGEMDGVKTCVPVQCLDWHPILDNGRMLSTHSGPVSFPTTLRYKCAKGYSIDGSVVAAKREFQAQCKPNGEFVGMTSCQKISCGAPRILPFATLVEPTSPRRSIEYDEVVKYSCFDGYSVSGSHGRITSFTVQCPDDGVLTDPAVCDPVKCGLAPKVPKARAAISGQVFFGMQLKYNCDTGYTLDGTLQGAKEFQRHCLSDGQFSELAPTQHCLPIYGGVPPTLENALMAEYGGRPVTTTPTSIHYPNGLEYRCYPGFTENGSPSGAVKISARVNSLGKLAPALPKGCLPITYAIRGQVKDARNGRHLDGVKVHVQGDNQSAPTSSGFFGLLGIRPGNATLVYKKEGYIDAMKIFSINGNVNVGGPADVSMSPKMSPDQWRAVLKWGARPADLDTYYMDGKKGGTKVYWQRKRRRVRKMQGLLENDVSSGYGPETLFLSDVGKCPANERACDIRYWINDYSRSGTMKDISQAQVTLYNGDRIAGTFAIDACKNTVSDDGNWWHVFTIDGKRNKLKWNCKQGPSASMLDLHHTQTARAKRDASTPVVS